MSPFGCCCKSFATNNVSMVSRHNHTGEGESILEYFTCNEFKWCSFKKFLFCSYHRVNGLMGASSKLFGWWKHTIILSKPYDRAMPIHILFIHSMIIDYTFNTIIGIFVIYKIVTFRVCKPKTCNALICNWFLCL